MQRKCYARARCLFERAVTVGTSSDVPAARRALQAAERALAARQQAGGEEPYHNTEFRHAGMRGDLPWLHRCMRMGADPASEDSEGHTAMHMAAAIGTHDILHHLAGIGVPVNSRNLALRTPLHIAAQMAQLQCTQVLIELK